jgi:hypothetical protein
MTAHIRNAVVVDAARTNEPVGIAPTRIRVEMGDLYKLEDDEGALFTTLGMMAKQPARSILVEWHTTELRPKVDVITAATGPFPPVVGTDNLAVDNPDYFQVGMKIKHGITKEVMEVTRTPSSSPPSAAGTIDVTRAIGPTAAVIDIVAGDELLILGNTYGENARLRDPQSVTETHFTNDMEIKRDNFEISGTLRAVGEKGGLYHGNDVDLQRRDMMLRHKRDWNLTFLHGERNTGAALLDPSDRTMQGLIPFIEQFGTGRVNGVATLTEAEWNLGLKDAFRYGSSKKVAIMSRAFAAILDTLAFSAREISVSESLFGLRLNKWKSTHGDIAMIQDNGLEGDPYDQYCVVVDMDEKGGPKYKVLRDTAMMKDREENDQDGYQEEVLTEASAEWGNPDYHYLFNAVTA